MGWNPPPPEGTTTASPMIRAGGREDLEGSREDPGGLGSGGGAGGRKADCEAGSTPSPPTRGSKTSGYNFAVTCQWAYKVYISFEFYSQCALSLSYITTT